MISTRPCAQGRSPISAGSGVRPLERALVHVRGEPSLGPGGTGECPDLFFFSKLLGTDLDWKIHKDRSFKVDPESFGRRPTVLAITNHGSTSAIVEKASKLVLTQHLAATHVAGRAAPASKTVLLHDACQRKLAVCISS